MSSFVIYIILNCKCFETADYVYGGDGDDLLHANGVLNGDGGDDVLRGGKNTDVQRGGDGDDLLLGYSGDDIQVSFEQKKIN